MIHGVNNNACTTCHVEASSTNLEVKARSGKDGDVGHNEACWCVGTSIKIGAISKDATDECWTESRGERRVCHADPACIGDVVIASGFKGRIVEKIHRFTLVN